LPLSDTILEMETVEEDEQVVMPGPSTAVESVPVIPAQVIAISREVWGCTKYRALYNIGTGRYGGINILISWYWYAFRKILRYRYDIK